MDDQEIKQIFMNNFDCYSCIEGDLGPPAMTLKVFTEVIKGYFLKPTFTYPWNEAPPWAEFAATDKDGTRCWFDSEPWLTKSNEMWNCIGQYAEIQPKSEPQSLWRLSLQKRPV
jgi:hypothetical protein